MCKKNLKLATFFSGYLMLLSTDGKVHFSRKVNTLPYDSSFAFLKVSDEAVARELAKINGYRFVRPHTFATVLSAKLNYLSENKPRKGWEKLFAELGKVT